MGGNNYKNRSKCLQNSHYVNKERRGAEIASAQHKRNSKLTWQAIIDFVQVLTDVGQTQNVRWSISITVGTTNASARRITSAMPHVSQSPAVSPKWVSPTKLAVTEKHVNHLGARRKLKTYKMDFRQTQKTPVTKFSSLQKPPLRWHGKLRSKRLVPLTNIGVTKFSAWNSETCGTWQWLNLKKKWIEFWAWPNANTMPFGSVQRSHG